MSERTCSISNCGKPHFGRGWCSAHYTRARRWGDPLASAPRPTAEERFWAKVDKTGECWLWTGAKLKSGYGKFGKGGKYDGWELAHRAAYEMFVGPIPEGHTVDHLCWNPSCVRPSHLQAVTPQANSENRRGAMKRSRTGVRGVSICSRSGRFIVQVRAHDVLYRGGRYDTLEEAEAAAIALRNRVMRNNLADRRAS